MSDILFLVTIFSLILTILGLAFFESISSIDNAVINAQILSGMGLKARRWFLFWGLLLSVFVIRGLIPWLIVYLTNTSLGPLGAFTAAFSSDPGVVSSIERSAPILLLGGGVFLIFLFFNWLFLEEKEFGLKHERFFLSQGVWFYAVVSVILTFIVWQALNTNPAMALGAVIGSTAFFVTHGFKESAEKAEKKLLNRSQSDLSKLIYLEVIDATFSIDGVLGAFAFTLSIPIILLGAGIGALVVRQLTVGNIERIKKYVYLENGAMYSIFFLSVIMILNSFGAGIPEWTSPSVTFVVIAYFFLKSRRL